MHQAILCIDDQREVLAALIKDLEPLADDFDIYECESAQEAKEVIDDLRDIEQEIVLVICDHIMPAMNGLELLSHLKEQGLLPEAKVILLTGYAVHEDVVQAQQSFLDAFISKPWTQADLIKSLDALLPQLSERFPHVQSK